MIKQARVARHPLFRRAPLRMFEAGRLRALARGVRRPPNVLVVGDEGSPRWPRAQRGRRGRRRIPRRALEQRARAHRLHQPAVETLERRLPEGAPLERREQHEAAPDACRARGVRQPIGRLGPERAIDDDEVRPGVRLSARPDLRPSARSTLAPASARRAPMEGASNGEWAMMSTRVPRGPSPSARRRRRSRAAHAGRLTVKAKIDPPPGLSS